MEREKRNEINRVLYALKKDLTLESIKNFFFKYYKDLDINKSNINLLIDSISIEYLLQLNYINLASLNLKYKKTSKEYWIIRGWSKEYALKKAKECNKIYSHSYRLQLKGYSYEEAKKIESRSIKMGKESLKKRDDYDIIKRNFIHKPEHYLKKINPKTGIKFTLEEAKKEFSKKQSKSGKRSSINKTNDKINTRIEYYLSKGLSEKEAKKALFERQVKNGLNYYINKYGLKNGTIKYKERITKYADKIKKIRKEEPLRWINSFGGLKFYSDSSKRFFDSIIEEIEEIKKLNFYYAENEYFLYDKDNKKIVFYDFYIKDLNLIIEYHGIVWHPKKRIQEGWVHPYTKITSEKYYDYDKYKKELAIKNNIDIIEIFEDEILIKKKEIINELRKRINKRKNN